MNGEIPSVPITTLAGISSLTALLPELPLPTPLPHTVNSKSLLFHPKVADEAKQILSSTNDNLVAQLVHALRQTNTDHIELKDNLVGDAIEGDIPDLLKAILEQDPDVFRGGPKYSTSNDTGYYGTHSTANAYSATQSTAVSSSVGGSNQQPHTFQHPVSTNSQFQQQFLSFAQGHTSGLPATVNGGSPSLQGDVAMLSRQRGRVGMKPAAAGSPAQASAAPLDVAAEPLPRHHAPNHHEEDLSRDSTTSSNSHHNFGSSGRPKSTEPVVVLEPLLHEGIGLVSKLTDSPPWRTASHSDSREGLSLTPQVSLTRIDEGSYTKKEKRRHKKDVVSYNVVSSADAPTKLTLKLSKNKNSEDKRGTKRRRSQDEDHTSQSGSVPQTPSQADLQQIDESSLTMEQLQEMYGDFATSLTERVKRRRRQVDYNEDEEIMELDGADSSKPKEKERRKERRAKDVEVIDLDEDTSEFNKDSSKEAQKKNMSSKDERKMKRLELRVTLEDLMESPTFKKFNAAVDGVLEASEDVDLTELRLDDDDPDVVPTDSETIISRSLLSDLCSEAAKLKTMAVMNQVSHEKLVKVLTILQFNIRDGCKIMAALNPDDSHEEEQLWREVTMEKVLAAVDAGLTALYIMTSPGMPKEVYIEDVIERVIRMAKMQLQNTIFPDYDPVYRVDPKNKTGIQSNIKLKRAKASGAKHRTSIQLYNKLSDLVGTLSELIDMQELTDTIILQTSTLAVSPFFVENISELQLNALKLVTSIFTRYDKHRQLIVEDILSSLARLPSSKKNLRSYRLNAEEQIQMVTALLLQLIQCVVKLPRPEKDSDKEDREESDKQRKEREKAELMDKEVTIITSYENAMRTAHNFLVVFLRKCTQKGEEDYRPLFENFVYDLLATVNNPEWPGAELLLSLLGRLLVQQFSNRSVDMALRTASLDYLGIVAARLRKDAVSSKLNEEIVDDILSHIHEDEDLTEAQKKAQQTDPNLRTQNLQKALLEYLVYNAQNDHALIFARQFYVGQWFRDCSMEVEKAARRLEAAKAKEKENKDDEEDAAQAAADELQNTQEVQELVEKRKAFLMEQIASRVGLFANYKPNPSRLDYDSACLVTRYLASNRPFSQSFDIYLTQILKVLCETAIAVRTKAMKCLSAVVEADPGILARSDMQKGVHGRFMDQSTSVREAAVELVGKFILIRPELTAQYYDMLSDRILDTGISVRKRVIKIFRDICMEQVDFPKIPEMCVKMIRRVNDEEGIKKLVNETFQTMWFVPRKDKDAEKLLTRVMNITDVVAACRDTGYDWFEQLLENLLKKEEDSGSKPVVTACMQIVDCLVDKVLTLEGEDSQNRNYRLIACFSTLHLFCKVRPFLLAGHATTIQPYLNVKCSSQADLLVIHNVARILELAVPLMDHPSESFLAQLEEDMMKLVLKHGQMVLQSCVSCLGSVVNRVTHNYKLVRDCFQKFFGVLSKLMSEHQNNPRSQQLVSSRPTLLRSLFTVGLLCKHFDFDSEDFGEKRVSIRDKVFDVMLYFIGHEEEEVKHKALTGIGFLVVRHYEFMLSRELKMLYQDLLTDAYGSVRMRCQVLRNLQAYLIEEEEKMTRAEDEWRKTQHDKEDLKEMGDVQSGMASTIIQVYLKEVLESFFHSQSQVRMCALSVITLILGQGLVHPVQCVPYLICMGSDCDAMIRNKADDQLKDIDKKYPGFIQMKALQGVKMSYKLQELLQQDPLEPIRGIRAEETPVALNSYIYSLIRNNAGQRRALLLSMLNMFDDTAKTPLSDLVYYADNLAHFPYQIQSEPLFIIHQIDILVSVSGSNLIQACREFFFPRVMGEDGELTKVKLDDEDEEEDVEFLLSKMPDDCRPFQELYMGCQGCVLLLVLKQHLKDMYGFTDAKIQRYSPTDSSKQFDKPLTRKHGLKFNPVQAIELIRQGPMPEFLNDDARRDLVQAYIDFKQLMLSIDPDEDEDEEGGTAKATPGSTRAQTPAAGSTTPGAMEGAGDADVLDSSDSKTPSKATHTGAGDAGNDAVIVMDEDSLTTPAPPKRPAILPSRPSFTGGQSFSIPRVTMPVSASIPTAMGGSEKKGRRRKDPSGNTPRQSRPVKTPKPKKKKKRRRMSDSGESDDSDDDSDPDFTL